MQSPELSLDYFELFGLNPVFDIDPILLNAAQQRLQASHHPDRHVGSNEQDKRLSVQIASRVNQAYETLRDPVKRSRYLLEINGATLPDDSATTADTEEACRQGEDALARSEAIETRLEQRAAGLAREFVERFEAGRFDEAIESSRKMQFVQRIQQQLDELQFELEDF
jgi:molecular chaperone HscB